MISSYILLFRVTLNLLISGLLVVSWLRCWITDQYSLENTTWINSTISWVSWAPPPRRISSVSSTTRPGAIYRLYSINLRWEIFVSFKTECLGSISVWFRSGYWIRYAKIDIKDISIIAFFPFFPSSEPSKGLFLKYNKHIKNLKDFLLQIQNVLC